MKYRLDKPCSNCPFNRSGPGLRLRRGLMPGRFAEILRGLKRGDHFICHKTSSEDIDYEKGTCVAEMLAYGGLLCAGAIEWQAKRGIVSQALEICQRLFDKEKKNESTSRSHAAPRADEELAG